MGVYGKEVCLHISGCVFTLESVFSHTYVGVSSDSGCVSR